jgi:hypothetical protein
VEIRRCFDRGKVIRLTRRVFRGGGGSLALFLSGKVLGLNGVPLETVLDLRQVRMPDVAVCWSSFNIQTNIMGEYGFAGYRNRGKVTTDLKTGAFEILTVPIYGIVSATGYHSQR